LGSRAYISSFSGRSIYAFFTRAMILCTTTARFAALAQCGSNHASRSRRVTNFSVATPTEGLAAGCRQRQSG
jgi:hypothetical protein